MGRLDEVDLSQSLSRARWLVAAGVILIFLGALLFPFVANVTTDDRPPPIDESREAAE